MNKRSKSRIVFECFNICFLSVLMLVTIYPMLYVLFASLSDPTQFMTFRGILLKPLGFSLLAFQKAFTQPLLLRSYFNTLMILVVGVSINIVLTAIAAYFLSRKNVLWQKPIAVAIIITMYFQGGLIPLYFTVRNIGMYDNFWALVLPHAINTFNLMIMKTGFASVPIHLEESGRIDGAGHFTILFKIVIPLAMPTIAVMILYYGVSHWNAWFHASIFIQTQYKYPLQLLLRQILLVNDTSSMTAGMDAGAELAISETIKYAIIIIATVPILCVYPFLQKYFVKGVMIGAVKE